MANEFLTDQITPVETMITNLTAAITNLSLTGVISYTLDTGQGKQIVTREDISRLQMMLNSLYNLHDILCVRAGQSVGTFNIRPDC